jgi:hypothetical protein
LAALGGGDHFLDGQQDFSRSRPVLVPCRLRAVAAILGTAAGLDREQRRELNLVGVEAFAVHLLRAVDEIHQGLLVQRFDFGDRPVGFSVRKGIFTRERGGLRDCVHEF